MKYPKGPLTAALDWIIKGITAPWGRWCWERGVTPTDQRDSFQFQVLKRAMLMPATSTWVSHWGCQLWAALGHSLEPLPCLMLCTCSTLLYQCSLWYQTAQSALSVLQGAPAGCVPTRREGHQLNGTSQNTHALILGPVKKGIASLPVLKE